MAAGEPATKKTKLDEKDDPIFEQFRSDASRMLNLQAAIIAMTMGLHTKLKLCMKKIVCEDASAGVSFSAATVRTENYTSIESPVGLGTLSGCAAGIIFKDGLLVVNDFFRKGKLPKNEAVKKLLAKLLKFLLEPDHDVLLESNGYRESEWAVVIVQHLISKLTVDSNCIIDWSYCNKPLEKCPCKDHDDLVMKQGDTSYGSPNGWLGCADILVVDNLPVKVLTDRGHLIPDDKSDNQSVSSVSSDEVKCKEEFTCTKEEYQAQIMAQTIVFSFLQAKYNQAKLKNFLVPGIGIDSKSLLFYFYDSENDLLMATPYLEIWSPDKKRLVVDHVLFLWLTLNYRYFCTGPYEVMKKNRAGFKHAEKYRKEVQMPAHRKCSSTPFEDVWYDYADVIQFHNINDLESSL